MRGGPCARGKGALHLLAKNKAAARKGVRLEVSLGGARAGAVHGDVEARGRRGMSGRRRLGVGLRQGVCRGADAEVLG